MCNPGPVDASEGERSVTVAPSPGRWGRYAWAAGIVFVVAVVVETAISVTIPISSNDSATKIATELAAHRTRLLVVFCVCVVYAASFPIYLWKLYDLLQVDARRSWTLGVLILVGGGLQIALHATSDVGIYGLLDAKLASYATHHDPGISYTLYLATYALDSLADVFGSLFLLAAGFLAMRGRLLPGWLAWVAIVAAMFLFLQGFGLGGLIATFGLALDLIGFILFLVFVLLSSVIGLRHDDRNSSPRSGPQYSLRGPPPRGIIALPYTVKHHYHSTLFVPESRRGDRVLRPGLRPGEQDPR